MFRCLVSLALFALAPAAVAQTRLEWKFAEGDAFLLERVYSQKQVVDVNGKKFAQESQNTWLTSVLVKEKTSRAATLQLTIESVAVKSSGAGPTAELDAKLAQKLKGQSLTLTITPQGRITRLDGYDAFLKKLAENEGEMEKALRTLLSEESLRDGLEEIFAFLPERAVIKGDKWKRSATETAPPFGAFKSQFEYVYDGEQDGGHRVTYALKMTYQAPAAGSELLRVVKGALKGALKGEEGKGEMIFDVAKGRLIRGDKTLKIHGELTIESLGKQSTVEFHSEHALSIRVLDKKQ